MVKKGVKAGSHVQTIEYDFGGDGKGHIIKLDKDRYINADSGEIGYFNHSAETRADSQEWLKKTFENLCLLIDANIDTSINGNYKKCRWVTLTYAENMTDEKRLYTDFHAFWKRFKNAYKEYKIEYIICVEPQMRGAWHIHAFFIFDITAPYIDNHYLADLWGQGFVNIQSIKQGSNMGGYLRAYLTNVKIDKDKDKDKDKDMNKGETKNRGRVGGVSALAEASPRVRVVAPKIEDKSIIKGARLYLYKKGMRIYRHSRGVKLPIALNEKELVEVSSAKPTYTSSYSVSFTTAKGELVENKITRNYYNNLKLDESQ